MTIHDADLDAVLRAAFPQGYPLLRCEHGVELLRHGARDLIESPMMARSVLGARTTKALGLALRALGNRYIACANRLLELAEQPDPAREPDKPQLGAHNTETGQ